MSKEDNIFQAAANKLQKGRPSQPSRPSFNAPIPLHVLKNPEIEAALAKLKTMNNAFKEAFRRLASQKGMTPQELHTWLEDEKHLLPAERDLLNQLTSDLNSKVAAVTGVNPKKLRKSDKEVEQDSKNRKYKTLGSRKNWIPMR